MTLRRLLFPVISLGVLTGLFLLGHLFNAFHSEGLSPTEALLSVIASTPLSWGYALTSGLVFIGFLAWLPTQLPSWLLYTRFRRVDSAVLDNDPELCQQFYRALLDYRCRYGEKRFMQRLVGRFNFFYNYHRDALHWMNNLIRELATGDIPTNMILDGICSGHLGRVFSGYCYGGGLPSAFVSLDEPVYLLARMDSIEIWSASSRSAICVFDKHTLQVEPGQQHPHYANANLSGMEAASHKIRQLELRMPAPATNSPEWAVTSAQDKLADLQSWLAEQMPATDHSQQDNFGIAVTEIPTLENHTRSEAADSPLVKLLQEMLGRQIDAVFSPASLSIADPDISQSTVVLCSGLGIILVRDVPIAGTIHYSGEPHWTQIDAGSTQQFDNACLAAQHSISSLIIHLAEAGLDSWPVSGLVVFSHAEVQPELALGRQQVQCDVITLGQLPKWFASQSTDDRIRFTKDNYNELITLLDPARLQQTRVRQA